jgi:hypothetical protein
MADRCREEGERLLAEAVRRRAAIGDAESDLVDLARKLLAEEPQGDVR